LRSRTPTSFALLRCYAAEIARTNYGLTLRPGPIETDTFLAHIATKYAEMHGQLGAFLAAAMKAYWLEARSLADEPVVQDLLREIGLKGELVPDPIDAWLLTDGIEIDRELARGYEHLRGAGVGFRTQARREGPAALSGPRTDLRETRSGGRRRRKKPRAARRFASLS
jgi:hypothetical protein